ncbi:Uncharacterised protein [Shigella sonnei]|nr:Uncharacterised protein [Shigella sonnei]
MFTLTFIERDGWNQRPEGNIHNGVSHAPEDVGHANKDNLSSTFKQMRTKEEK